MTQLLSNLKTVVDDIQHSWYFRIWAFLWLFCVVFSFAVLILLGRLSTEATLEPTFHFWSENASTINYPRFHFRSQEDLFIGGISCSWNKQPLVPLPCLPRPNGETHDFTKCQAIDATNIVAENKRGDFRERFITCTFATNYTIDPNYLIAFEFEGHNIASYGINSFASVWFGPNNNTWILLNKAIVTYRNQMPLEEWDRELVYHSTVWHRGYYVVSIIINRFLVIHAEQDQRYDGWSALGEIGGFAFFLLMLHSFMMILVGICFTNNAKTLNGGGTSSEYVPVSSSKEERAAML